MSILDSHEIFILVTWETFSFPLQISLNLCLTFLVLFFLTSLMTKSSFKFLNDTSLVSYWYWYYIVLILYHPSKFDSHLKIRCLRTTLHQRQSYIQIRLSSFSLGFWMIIRSIMIIILKFSQRSQGPVLDFYKTSRRKV